MGKRWNIGMVGFGVAGATCAWLLARAGHRVRVFDQAESLGPVGNGVLLQPSGQMVLARLGVLSPIAARCEPIDRLYAVNHRGKVLIDLPYAEVAEGCRAYGMHRGVLFEMLHKQARDVGAEIVPACRIERRVNKPDGVRLLDACGTSHGPFDLVIVGDGSRSSLRGTSGLRHVCYEYPHGALWMTGDCPDIRGHLWQVTRGTRLLCGLLPIGAGRASFFWSIEKQDLGALRARGMDRWRDAVLKVCPHAAPMLAGARSFDDLQFTTYRHVYMPRPFDARTMFIGDAAHSMSPHLGQGVNLALLDAYVLCEEITRRGSPRDAFVAAHSRRKHHVALYAALTAGMSPFFQSRGFIKGIGRDLVLPLLPRVPWVRRRMVVTMAGLRGGWWGGRVS